MHRRADQTNAEPTNAGPTNGSVQISRSPFSGNVSHRSPQEVSAVNLSVLDPIAEVAGDAELPCRSYDPELFFAESPADVELAKAICHDCPIRQGCLQGALARGEPWGVWGGELFVAGAVVPRKRPRGRPRKDDAARYEAASYEVARREPTDRETESAKEVAA